jgi:hypothetical protein
LWLSRGRRRSCVRSPTIWCGAVGYCRRWAEDNLLGRLGPSSVPILSRSAILPPIHARSMGGRGTVGAGAARVACPTPPFGVYLSARFPALWGPRGGMLWPPVDLPLPRAAAPTVRTNATSSTCSTHCLWYARHHPAGSPLRVLYRYSTGTPAGPDLLPAALGSLAACGDVPLLRINATITSGGCAVSKGRAFPLPTAARAHADAMRAQPGRRAGACRGVL